VAREAHVLEAIRQQHDIPHKKVRRAVALLERQFGSRHPLADDQFERMASIYSFSTPGSSST